MPGNACDRRRWRKQGAGVGTAVEKAEENCEAPDGFFGLPQEGRKAPSSPSAPAKRKGRSFVLLPFLLDRENLVRSMGSASAFMITGSATKITNFGALKIVLGMKRFLLYLAFVMAFSLVTGLLVNLIV